MERIRLSLIATVMTTVLLIAATAHANPFSMGAAPVSKPTEEPVDTETTRYGGYLFATDMALLATGFATKESRIPVFGYLASGPLHHALRGNTPGAVGSATLRVTAPLLGVALHQIAASASDCTDSAWCSLDGLAVAAMAGAGIAVIIDTVFIAKTTRRTDRGKNAATAIRYRGVTARPDVLLAASGRMSVGLQGSF